MGKKGADLNLSLWGVLNKQAQHGPDWLNKSRAEWDEDRSARLGSAKEAGEPDQWRATLVGSR